jgi:hypothetical protein
VLLLLGCSRSERQEGVTVGPQRLRWESEHFVLHSQSDDSSWCQGVLNTLEHHFEVLQQTLGFSWPQGARVEYHKFANQKALRAEGVCSGSNDACFFADKGVYTTDPLELHELVHAYLVPLGDSHPVLEEGIAEALDRKPWPARSRAASLCRQAATLRFPP